MSIAIIDLKLSNVKSVQRAISLLGGCSYICESPQHLSDATKIILPGVGNFNEASSRLDQTGFGEAIVEKVRVQGKPILGICLGMQLLAKRGHEGGVSNGLGLIDAEIRLIETELPLPHIGWNSITTEGTRLLSGIPSNTCFYFVHSYHMYLESPAIVSYCDYGQPIIAYIETENIFGTQFHPEKSQKFGLKILNNFIEIGAPSVKG